MKRSLLLAAAVSLALVACQSKNAANEPANAPAAAPAPATAPATPMDTGMAHDTAMGGMAPADTTGM